MTAGNQRSFGSDFRRFFIRGLATILPTVLTIVLFVKCFEFIQENISVHITRGVVYVVVMCTETEKDIGIDAERLGDYLQQNNIPSSQADDAEVLKGYRQERLRIVRAARRAELTDQWSHGPRALAGFAVAVVLVYIVGVFLASLVGHKLWQVFEQTVLRAPGFKQVYPYVKQVTDYLFGEQRVEFSRVVAIPYPRKDVYSIGLVTGAGFKAVHQTVKKDFLTVFIPSSPTPVTGYVVYVRKEEVIDLPITIEEALRFAVSGGVIVPDRQAMPGQVAEVKSDVVVNLPPEASKNDGGPDQPQQNSEQSVADA